MAHFEYPNESRTGVPYFYVDGKKIAHFVLMVLNINTVEMNIVNRTSRLCLMYVCMRACVFIFHHRNKNNRKPDSCSLISAFISIQSMTDNEKIIIIKNTKSTIMIKLSE